jgi:DNA polymerase
MGGDRDPIALLDWHLEAGVDTAVAETPVDRYAASARPPEPKAAARPAPTPPPEPPPAPPEQDLLGAPPQPARTQRAPRGAVEAVANARELAAAAKTLSELEDALHAFEGCPLKHTATNLVFGDGTPDRDVMFVGEAPGADEDRQGKPFVGVSGQLLDRMVAWIGLDRGNFYITNMLYWRPPGNRNPTTAELAACQPFVQRHIELVRPRLLVFVGGASASALLGRSEGIMRLRGRWFEYESPGLAAPLPATAIFHPAYLLRRPAEKRLVWRDLLAIRARLDRPD